MSGELECFPVNADEPAKADDFGHQDPGNLRSIASAGIRRRLPDRSMDLRPAGANGLGHLGLQSYGLAAWQG